MKIFNTTCKFASLVTSQPQVVAHTDHLRHYLDGDAQSTGVKAMFKAALALNRTIQKEANDSDTTVVEDINGFLRQSDFEVKECKQFSIFGLTRHTDTYEVSIITFPKDRSYNFDKFPKEFLSYTELHKFDEYFRHNKIQKLLPEEEAMMRQDLVDSTIDENNPLGLDFMAIAPLDYFINIRKKGLQDLMIKCLCTYGKVGTHHTHLQTQSSFLRVQFMEPVDDNLDWNHRSTKLVEQFNDEVDSFAFQNFSDMFQLKIIELLNTFGLDGSEVYYLELMAAHKDQQQYLQWLQDMYVVLDKNKLHAD